MFQGTLRTLSVGVRHPRRSFLQNYSFLAIMLILLIGFLA